MGRCCYICCYTCYNNRDVTLWNHAITCTPISCQKIKRPNIWTTWHCTCVHTVHCRVPWAGHHQRCSWWRERVATAWAAPRRSQGWHSWSGYRQTPYHASHQTKLQCLEPCKGEDNQLFMKWDLGSGLHTYIHLYTYSKTARIFHSVCLCYSMIKLLVSKWIRREGEIPYLNKHLCCMYPRWLYFGGEGCIHMIVMVSVLHVFVHQFQSVNPIF